MKHGCDVVIMIRNKHGDGDTINVYGTEGAGVAFLGNKASRKASEGGELCIQMYKRFLRGTYKDILSQYYSSTFNDYHIYSIKHCPRMNDVF